MKTQILHDFFQQLRAVAGRTDFIAKRPAPLYQLLTVEKQLAEKTRQYASACLNLLNVASRAFYNVHVMTL